MKSIMIMPSILLKKNIPDLNENYYKDCIKTLEDWALSQRQKELNEKFKNCTDIEQRKIIAKELYEISMQMKKKNHKEN